MPSAIITCPSGLTGEIRSPKVRELRAFIDGVRRSFSTALTDLLAACWVRTEDPGIYAEPLRWGDVLAGDRLYAWIQARILAFGADLDFTFQCDSTACREINPETQGWSARLDELKVIALSEDSRERFAAGNRFPAEVAGQKLWFRLMTGTLEAEVERRARKRKANYAEAMAERILEVDGVGTKLADITEWVDGLDSGDLARLGQALEAADCGVELGISVQCEYCRRVVVLDVPFVENWGRLAKKQTGGRST